MRSGTIALSAGGVACCGTGSRLRVVALVRFTQRSWCWRSLEHLTEPFAVSVEVVARSPAPPPQVDIQKTGAITYSEFVAAMVSDRTHTSRQNCEAAFQVRRGNPRKRSEIRRRIILGRSRVRTRKNNKSLREGSRKFQKLKNVFVPSNVRTQKALAIEPERSQTPSTQYKADQPSSNATQAAHRGGILSWEAL